MKKCVFWRCILSWRGDRVLQTEELMRRKINEKRYFGQVGGGEAESDIVKSRKVEPSTPEFILFMDGDAFCVLCLRTRSFR